MQENRSAAAQFRQKPLLGKAQSPFSFNALEILHGRLNPALASAVHELIKENGLSVEMITCAHGNDHV
ncbi:MAG: hypothetical protein WAK37_04220, partial [Pseudolabrys sp.]